MIVRYYAQRCRELAATFFNNAVAVGRMCDLSHFRAYPDLQLEPPMQREQPRPHGAILPSGTITGGKPQFTMRTPMDRNQQV